MAYRSNPVYKNKHGVTVLEQDWSGCPIFSGFEIPTITSQVLTENNGYWDTLDLTTPAPFYRSAWDSIEVSTLVKILKKYPVKAATKDFF